MRHHTGCKNVMTFTYRMVVLLPYNENALDSLNRSEDTKWRSQVSRGDSVWSTVGRSCKFEKLNLPH